MKTKLLTQAPQSKRPNKKRNTEIIELNKKSEILHLFKSILCRIYHQAFSLLAA